MIPSTEIRKLAKEWNLPEETIEKDYLLGWVLWGIANNQVLKRVWIFRGGTCIKKCYVNTHRYSEDLDFTVLPRGPYRPDELTAIFNDILPIVNSYSGIDFKVREPKFELLPHGRSTQGKIYFRGPRQTPTPISVKLDIVAGEQVVRPPVLRPISHPYSDEMPSENNVYCYNLEEIFAEKIRAMMERSRPRDLYDIIYLYRRSDLHAEPHLIRLVLEDKCAVKGLQVPDVDYFLNPSFRSDIVSSWSDMLGHQLGYLPSHEDFFAELPNFYAWLNGEDIQEQLPSIINVSEDETWEPPILEWQRGQSDLLEPVRFAAVNRLCLNLGYQNKTRDIEPYSLRRTREGNTLLYALRADNKQTRAYRIDRIQSILVTNQPFKPTFRIEFSPEGRFTAPFLKQRQEISSRLNVKRYSSGLTGTTYIIECSYCGKTFRRKKYDLKLNKHKQKDSDWDCYGRIGYLVDTVYE
jgi:predicted nucleotidyltransferase component of viral defense system